MSRSLRSRIEGRGADARGVDLSLAAGGAGRSAQSAAGLSGPHPISGSTERTAGFGSPLVVSGSVRPACDDLRMDTSRADDRRAAERHERIGTPTIGRMVTYRTDGRGGPAYDLPAVITCTAATHPDATEEDLSGGWSWRDVPGNPVPIPCTHDGFVHLHVMTPGPTGQYTELTVPFDDGADNADGEPRARSWRWPARV